MNNLKTLIITGGGRGIGAATARLAARRGFAVCINFLNDRASAHAVVESIRHEGGVATAIQADIGVEEEVRNLFETAEREFGKPVGLVNNAATLEPQARLEAMPIDRMRRMLETNVVGPMICSREAVLRMSTRHGGSGGVIVNLSSVAASSGAPGEYIDYAASKGAIETFTKGLSKEVAEEGIRVNCVRPGFIYTEIHAKGGEPKRVDRVKALVPMQRGGQPEEVAAAIVWLLSDEASYVTGAILDVTGGR